MTFWVCVIVTIGVSVLVSHLSFYFFQSFSFLQYVTYCEASTHRQAIPRLTAFLLKNKYNAMV
jgi:hypothetical protein